MSLSRLACNNRYMTQTAKYELSSTDHLVYDLGCTECDARKGEPCITGAHRVRRWHPARIVSAERHFNYGHKNGDFCACGLVVAL